VGLPARQRRVLESIEDRLRRSDPRLAAMFTIFARLTRDEEMPRFEQLRHRAELQIARFRLITSAIGRRLAGRTGRMRRAGRRYQLAVFFPLALVLMTLAIVLVARFGGASRCPAVTTVAAAKPHPRAKLIGKAGRRCRATVLTPIPIGR
jgi:hypothetical protein